MDEPSGAPKVASFGEGVPSASACAGRYRPDGAAFVRFTWTPPCTVAATLWRSLFIIPSVLARGVLQGEGMGYTPGGGVPVCVASTPETWSATSGDPIEAVPAGGVSGWRGATSAMSLDLSSSDSVIEHHTSQL